MPSHFDTLQLHAGQPIDSDTHARAPPIYATLLYAFESAQHGAQLFGLEKEGYIYLRIMNPTNDVFEKRIAALEGGIGAVAVSSGHAAQFLAISALAQNGDNFISSLFLYGGTVNQFSVTFKRFGVEARIVDGDLPADFEKLIDDRTKAFYFELIGNPKYLVPDFDAFAKLSAKYGIPIVVDNTFGAGGFTARPIDHGAHVVVHLATKWIGGHGTTIGGVIVDLGKFPWKDHPERFPQFSQPTPSYHGLVLNEALGAAAFIGFVRIELLRDIGPTLNPFALFLLLQGLETLLLRVERQNSNTLALAKWLEANENVAWVLYPGLESHSHHELAKKYLTNGFGGVLSFGVKPLAAEVSDPFQESGARVVDLLKLATHLANVGDSKTLVITPYYTTHQQLSAEAKQRAGVTKDLIRVSVGTEFIDDIIGDFKQAFDQVFQ